MLHCDYCINIRGKWEGLDGYVLGCSLKLCPSVRPWPSHVGISVKTIEYIMFLADRTNYGRAYASLHQSCFFLNETDCFELVVRTALSAGVAASSIDQSHLRQYFFTKKAKRKLYGHKNIASYHKCIKMFLVSRDVACIYFCVCVCVGPVA